MSEVESFPSRWASVRSYIHSLIQYQHPKSESLGIGEVTAELGNENDLTVIVNNDETKYELIFSPDNKRSVVISTSNIENINEEKIKLGPLVETQIIQKIRDFAYQASKGAATKRSPGDWRVVQ